MRLYAAATRDAVVTARFEDLRDIARYLAEYNVVAAEVVEVEVYAQQATKRVARLLIAGIGVIDRTGDQAGTAQVLPDFAGLVTVVGTVPAARDIAVAVAVVGTAPIACETGLGGGIVARQHAVAILVRVNGRRDASEIVLDPLDLGVGDHLASFEDAADQQADDDKHDGDFNQGKARLPAPVEKFHIHVKVPH